ncbi:MAG: hypothetical protein M3Q88_01215 [Pseudomonadota bacterium]|nr:hypothetical protein [Pseudomonadota bacterium]
MDRDFNSADETQWHGSSVLAVSCLLLVVAALFGSAFSVAEDNWMGAAAWAACATIGVLALIFRRTLPPLFGLLLIIAAVVNTAGYVFDLWRDRTMFDEIVHAFTTFAGLASAGWLFLRQRPQAGDKLIWIAVGVGLAAGLAWEAFEYAIGMIGDLKDTIIDLVMDMIGAAAAGALVRWLAEPGVASESVSHGIIQTQTR